MSFTEKDFAAMAKENYLLALAHKPTYWQPIESESYVYGGFEFSTFEKGPFEDGVDGFGVRWIHPRSGGGGALTDPAQTPVLDDICNWRDLSFPDIENYDWAGEAAAAIGEVDPALNNIDYGSGDGHFERLAAVMGFENALISLVEEPEECEAFFDKITEYKINVMYKAKKYYNPDTFTLYDDTCAYLSPFMSPSVFEELILPQYKKVFDACKNEGIHPVIHCCGYATPWIEYFIQSGAEAWTSVQACNDIAALCKKYGDKICLSGGFDAFRLSGNEMDLEKVKAEVDRCFTEYGGLPGYIFCGGLMRALDDEEPVYNAWEPTYALGEYAITKAHQEAGYDFKATVNAFTV